MKHYHYTILLGLAVLTITISKGHPIMAMPSDSLEKYTKPSATQIKQMLTPMQYEVTQEEATEPAFKNEYWDNKEPGIYVDVVTGEPLFASVHKYKSGTGWPSFTQPITENALVEKVDRKLWMKRIEVKSKIGDSHLGHVFEDGPEEAGGMRYCINSAALKFIPLDQMKSAGYSEYLYLFEK